MTALRCDDLACALAGVAACEETTAGLRIATQCLYPSFEPVQVFVSAFGEGAKVHDGGGAARFAWDYGRSRAATTRALAEQALAYQLVVTKDNALVADAVTRDWIASAILAVANASAAAAHALLSGNEGKIDDTLQDRIEAAVRSVVTPDRIAREYSVRGRSGKEHRFDFALRRPTADKWLLIDGVAPHHVSVSAKYVAFADTGTGQDPIIGRYAVYQRPLDTEDASLLQQVADLVPVASLANSVRRELAS